MTLTIQQRQALAHHAERIVDAHRMATRYEMAAERRIRPSAGKRNAAIAAEYHQDAVKRLGELLCEIGAWK
ncbi:MAG: hypothetical protein NTY53_23705 [Kiritimatiellaeota bacterium]|nr:hypothetical protein [Kiritimatiellota bacterium]